MPSRNPLALTLCLIGCADPAKSAPIVAQLSPSAGELLPAIAPDDTSPIGSVAPAASLAATTTATSSLAPQVDPDCPADMVRVANVCVDRHEAHLVGPTGEPHPYFERPVAGIVYSARNSGGMHPQGYVSRVEAKKACEASEKRLCSRREWQRACKFKGWGNFPYQGAGIRSRCNSGKAHLLTQLYPNPKGGFKYEEHFNSPELNKTAGFLAASGEYADCSSDVGIKDMVGNLHEWVSDTVTQEFVDRLSEEPVERREQPWVEGNGVFMGGFFSTTSEHGPGCTFTTIAHEPSYHDYSTGFRCCRSLPRKLRPKELGGQAKVEGASSVRR